MCLSFCSDSEGLPGCLRVWWLYIWNRGKGQKTARTSEPSLFLFLPLLQQRLPGGMRAAPQSLFNNVSWVTLILFSTSSSSLKGKRILHQSEMFIKSHNLFSIQRFPTIPTAGKWPVTNNKQILVVDEVQEMSPHQLLTMKTNLITSGEGGQSWKYNNKKKRRGEIILLLSIFIWKPWG